MSDLSIMIAGEAGQGLVTIGQILTRSLVRSGLHVLVQQDYQSRVRGGLNSWRIRYGDAPVLAPCSAVDLLLALSPEAVGVFAPRLRDDGLLIADARYGVVDERLLAVPMDALKGAPAFYGVAALAVAVAAIGCDPGVVEGVMAIFFDEDTLEKNRGVFRKALAWAMEGETRLHGAIPSQAGPPALAITGNEALALGAMAAGCNFVAYYPMTPATSVVQTLITHGEASGVFVEQVEDELAAINMAIGAGYAGARAMVATSGGGMALMSEGVSLAAMTETPVVIMVAQRPGPATGLPTRTEQGDLDLVRFSGHGEFPRVILAPDTPESCFYLTHHAFDLAERFQGPVFILTDQYLADSTRDVPPFDLHRLPPMTTPSFSVSSPYERYAWSDETGISPRRVPGFSKALVVADSDEHTPDGHLTEVLEIRTRMQEKRMRKETGLEACTVPPTYSGEAEPDLLLISWGSTGGACREASSHLGRGVATLHFSQPWPLNAPSFQGYLDRAKRVVVVEGNYTGQFERLLVAEAGCRVDDRVRRYDGLPITAEWIETHLEWRGEG